MFTTFTLRLIRANLFLVYGFRLRRLVGGALLFLCTDLAILDRPRRDVVHLVVAGHFMDFGRDWSDRPTRHNVRGADSRDLLDCKRSTIMIGGSPLAAMALGQAILSRRSAP